MKNIKRASVKRIIKEMEELYLQKKEIEVQYKALQDELKRRYPAAQLTEEEKKDFIGSELKFVMSKYDTVTVDTEEVKKLHPDWQEIGLAKTSQRFDIKPYKVGSHK